MKLREAIDFVRSLGIVALAKLVWLFDLLPWYVKHVLVALVIMAVIWPLLGAWAGACAGSAFYIGREYVEWEKYQQSKRDSWLGCVPATFITCLLAAVVSWWFK